MTFYDGTELQCDTCSGRGIPEDDFGPAFGACIACNGTGKKKREHVDPESLCMHDGCDKQATLFEAAEAHWHDYVWCAEHANGKTTIPLKGEADGTH